jgi:hypothetical protein
MNDYCKAIFVFGGFLLLLIKATEIATEKEVVFQGFHVLVEGIRSLLDIAKAWLPSVFLQI